MRGRRRASASSAAVDDEQDALGAGSTSGWSEPPPGETSTTYWLKVSANPDSGRASTQSRVASQPGRWDAVMSLSVRAGITAYASVNRARSVVSAVCGGSPPFGT